MPPQSNSCFNHYITIIFNCKGFFINIFWICVYVRFFGLVLLLNLRYQLDVCVGANTVRPSKKQTHGNNKVRQQKILPYNSEFTSNPEHGRTLFAPTDCSGEVLLPQNRYAPCLSTSLFSFAHSSFLISHSSFLIPHLIPLPSCILPHFRL